MTTPMTTCSVWVFLVAVLATIAPLNLWLTDRSRWKAAVSCARKRFLAYHYGPTGYGITTKRDSLPLVTGIVVHAILEAFARLLAKFDRLPDLIETRDIINDAVAGYVARVEARGYLGILSSDHTEETVKEQSTLASGLGWAIRLKFLPWLLQTYRIVAVEQERIHFLSCTCGAPPLDTDEHIRRGCHGQGLMIRTDLLTQRRSGGTLAYFEAKTTGWESAAWSEKWETDPQLAIGTLDAQQLWGAEVTETFILGLSKGSRQRDRYEDDPMKRQLSPLCYGFARPSNPPLQPEDWVSSYEWVNEHGEVKRKSKAHRRKGVWHLYDSDWPTWRAYATANPDMNASEFWVRMLPPSILDKTCFILGPMNRQDQQLESLMRGFAGEESRWQAALWEMYELQQAGHEWASDTYQHRLDAVVPCSWNCRPYGRDHECEFVPICHKHSGWDDPLGTGKYQPRLPHHQPELDQAVARGLLPAEAEAIDEEE